VYENVLCKKLRIKLQLANFIVSIKVEYEVFGADNEMFLW